MEEMIGVPVFSGVFVLALILGAVVNKTHFCTMGAVSDWVNMGDKTRFGAWMLAIAVAAAGVWGLEAYELATVDSTRPPYRSANFAWARYVLGGLMFGVGMTLASGCTTKTIIRLGGGNIKSLFVLVIVGIFAYLMTMTDFYGVVFDSWMAPLAVNLGNSEVPGQDFGNLIAGFAGVSDASTIRGVFTAAIALIVLIFVMRTAGIKNNGTSWLAGIVVGLCVVGAWYLTGGEKGVEWIEAAEWADERPLGVGVQSFTFVNPMGETLNYFKEGGDMLFLTFGVVALAGVFLGSLIYAVTFGNFRFEWFASWGDFFNHIIGATLMGIGGVLAMGCTVGQGVTGVSTLSLGSFMALGSIIIACAATLKIQFYRMMYDDASMMDALLSSLADLHLLPSGMRKLEAV